MKLHILSDLHLEFLSKPPYAYELPEVGADVVVLAGDIGLRHHGAAWAARESARLGKPFLYVCGNHEFYKYRGGLTDTKDIARAAATRGEVHFLERGEVSIGGVRFLGATLWTDFQLFGEQSVSYATWLARREMTDFELIVYSGWPHRVKLNPSHLKAIHRDTRNWLDERLFSERFAGPTVVVTHHAPLKNSVDVNRYDRQILAAAYASNLEVLFNRRRVALWVHGHTHRPQDYLHRGVRVVCNPQGYPHQKGTTGFRADFVVEV